MIKPTRLRTRFKSLNAAAFSLIEMLVVLAIVGALGAAAFTSFLGYRARARDAAAGADAKFLYREARSLWTKRRDVDGFRMLLDADYMYTKFGFYSSRSQGRFTTMVPTVAVGNQTFKAVLYHPYGATEWTVTQDGWTFDVNGDKNPDPAPAMGARVNNHLHPAVKTGVTVTCSDGNTNAPCFDIMEH